MFFLPSQGPREPGHGHGGPGFSKFCVILFLHTVSTGHFTINHMTSTTTGHIFVKFAMDITTLRSVSFTPSHGQ